MLSSIHVGPFDRLKYSVRTLCITTVTTIGISKILVPIQRSYKESKDCVNDDILPFTCYKSAVPGLAQFHFIPPLFQRCGVGPATPVLTSTVVTDGPCSSLFPYDPIFCFNQI